MEIQVGKNIEKYFAGGVKKEVTVPSRTVESAFNAGKIGALRKRLKSTLSDEMNKVRANQMEKSPSSPLNNYFAKNFLADLDAELGDISDIGEDQKYDLRFYSASDTSLDYLGGFDCWVELYDLEKGKVLKTIKIDITSNPNKQFPGQMADIVLYVDPKYLDAKAKGKISGNFFDSKEYGKLLSDAKKMIEASNVIKRTS